jgi:long-subunit fatty acid transport protein
MGGAFIGVADDATAASWNPGGLIQLERPEVSIVLSYDRRYEKRSFEQNAGASGDYDISLYDVNYFSLAYPFVFLTHNMIVSFNYQTLYDFNKEHSYDYLYRSRTTFTAGPITVNTSLNGARQTDQETEGYLKALSPAVAFQLTPALSLGLTFNVFHESLGSRWDTDYDDALSGTQVVQVVAPPSTTTYNLTQWSRYRDQYEFRTSVNPLNLDEASFHLGFLWTINSFLTLGGVYKPAYTAEVKYKETFESYQYVVNVANPADQSTSVVPYMVIADERQEIDMPASYGLGLSCRFSDAFTMDLDLYRTDWQHFVLRQADGREISLITGQERSLAETEPTHQVRLGGEYLFMVKNKYVVPLRAGAFYDPEPTENEPDAFYGFSLGAGITVGSLVFDMAYQYRWGNDVRKVRLGSEEIYQDVRQHTVYGSLIYHF